MQEDLDFQISLTGQQQFMAGINQMNAGLQRIEAQTSKFSDKNKAASTSIGSVGKSAGMVGGLLGGALAVGIGAATSALTSLASEAFRAASNYETLSIQLGVMLGNASKVPAVLEEWRKFSDLTPMEPEQINKAGRQLLAFGFDVKSLIPIMTKIGDVSAGTGKDFNELTTIYGKVKVAGRAMGDDLRQLLEAGVPIMEELALVMGVSVDQVRKMGEQGKITFPVFEAAFARLAAPGSKFGGMMDKLSRSTEGLLSTLKGEFNNVMREIGTAFLPVIKDLVTAAIPLLKKGLEELKPILSQIPVYFQQAKKAIEPLWNALVGIYKPLAQINSVLSPVIDAFTSLGSTSSATGEDIGTVSKVLTVVGDVLQWVADAITYVTDSWNAFLADSPRIKAAIEYIGQAFEYILNPMRAVGDLWNYIFGTGANSVGGLSERSKGHIAELTRVAIKEFGATSEQVKAFSATLQASEFAGLSSSAAMELLKQKFELFMQTANASKAATEGVNAAIGATTGRAIPAAGSIDTLNEKLKLLKDQFQATADSGQRMNLGADIAKLEDQIELYEQQANALNGVTIQTKAVTDAQTMMATATQNAAAQLANMQASTIQAGETTLTVWEKLQSSIGETAFGALQQGLDQIKSALRDFGISAVESFGYAIGAGESFADAMKQQIAALAAEIPRMAGMALINASATAPPPANLAMLAAGLTLVGMGGLLKGLNAANQKKRESESMSSAAGMGVGGSGMSASGLAAYTVATASQQQQPLNVSLVIDGVQFGNIVNQTSMNYGKMVIKG